MIKVIIADDSLIVRSGLKDIIEQDNDIEVIGLATNGNETLELCKKNQPDLILMDIKMPVCDGVEGTKLIKDKYSSVKVIIVTTFDDDSYINDALKNGADGYVLKDISDEDLIRTIKNTVNGFSTVPGNIFHNFIVKNLTQNKASSSIASPYSGNLTLREKEIIKLIVDGKDNKEIAKNLYLVEGTVRNIIHSILSKLKLKDRTQLAVFAIKNDIA